MRAASGTWDCVVVGAGPAGLSAAVYMGRFRRRTLVLDAGDGRWSYGQRNDNYLGFPRGVSARRLQALGRAQAERFGVAFEDAVVSAVLREQPGFRLQAGNGAHRARTVIWAAGVRDRWPAFPGARALVGRRLFWCLVCDGWRARERAVLLLANSRHDARTALQFLTYTPRLTLLVEPDREPRLAGVRRRLEGEGIAVRVGRVRAVRERRDAPEAPAAVSLDDGQVLCADYVFSLLGYEPRVGPLRGLPLQLSRLGHVHVDGKNCTTLPGLFAAGDVTDRHSHQIATAVHEGASAAQSANQALYPPRQRLE